MREPRSTTTAYRPPSGGGTAHAPLAVYYDGECPLCVREIRWLQSRTPASDVDFVDFAVERFDFDALGVDRSTLMGQIHARVEDGSFVTGVEVFRLLYAAAGLGWLVGWTRWPGLDRLADAAYRLFARNRLRITGRQDECEGACAIGAPPPQPGRRSVHRLERRVRLAIGADEAFAFFCDPHNLEAITPPELRFRITETPSGPLGEGSEIRYSMRLRGVSFRWHTLIKEWSPGHGFVDQALSSPYSLWHHRHTLRPIGPNETEMIDQIDYRLPLAPLGDVALPFVRRELDAIFDYRERAILERFGGRRVDVDLDRDEAA